MNTDSQYTVLCGLMEVNSNVCVLSYRLWLVYWRHYYIIISSYTIINSFYTFSVFSNASSSLSSYKKCLNLNSPTKIYDNKIFCTLAVCQNQITGKYFDLWINNFSLFSDTFNVKLGKLSYTGIGKSTLCIKTYTTLFNQYKNF